MITTRISIPSKSKHLLKAVLIAFLLLSASCKNEKKPEQTPLSDEMEQVTVIQSKLGRKIWKLEASQLEFSGDTVWADSLKLTFFRADGDIASVLFADSGYAIQQTGEMTAYGHVHVISADSSELWTDSLSWDPVKEVIVTDSHVKLKENERILEGEGLESDASLKRIKIKGEVVGHGGIGEKGTEGR